MSIKPMLGDNKPWNEAIIQRHLDTDSYLWMQPKIDGLRTLVDDSCIPRSRSGKEHKHAALRKFLMDTPSLRGFDFELSTGHEYDKDTFRKSMSQARAELGDKAFTLFIYDYYPGSLRYEARLDRFRELVNRLGEFRETDGYHARLIATPTWKVHTLAEIYEHEVKLLEDEWEGGMLRRDGRAYKHGRATALGGELLKLKRNIEDSEAVVIGYEAWERNDNSLTASPLGYASRSAHKEGMTPLERLGAWKVELLSDRSVKFKVGVLKGVTHSDRDQLWKDRDSYIGKVMRFKHQGYSGGYDSPRTPVFLNWRPASEF